MQDRAGHTLASSQTPVTTDMRTLRPLNMILEGSDFECACRNMDVQLMEKAGQAEMP